MHTSPFARPDLSASTAGTAAWLIALLLSACSSTSNTSPDQTSATSATQQSPTAGTIAANTTPSKPSAQAGGAAARSGSPPPAAGSAARDVQQAGASAAMSGAAGSTAPATATTTATTTATAGTTASAGASGSAGVSGNTAGQAGAPATAATSCGGASNTAAAQPFGCKFAWGTNDPGGSLAAFAGLSFMSKWVGYEIDMSGNLPRCDGCSWLKEQVGSTQLVPVYYAYFVGYFGKANGLPDGNENPNGPNLTTDAAKLIRAQKPKLISLYRDYAKQTAQAWPDKPIVWLLEGDFVQYTSDTQKEPLTLDELAGLGQDIACAIKSEMPNAVVAINHSTWNSDELTNNFWNAMNKVSYDLVWTTGVANNNGFFEKDADASKYNAKTANYAYVHQLTGRNIFVDTSFGISEMADSWSSADPATLNARIKEGVIAANVTKPPEGYVAKATTLQAKLNPVCQ